VLERESEAVRFDRSLLRAVGRARRWSQQLLSGQFPSIGSIARRERIAPRYIRDLMPLAFLSPEIVKAIVEGRQPADLFHHQPRPTSRCPTPLDRTAASTRSWPINSV